MKRSKPEIDKIIDEIIELVLNGYPRKAIVQYCSETHSVSDRQTDNYLAKAYEAISSDSQKYRTKLITQTVRRFNTLYDKNFAIQDYRECRQVQESICKLFGLNEASKIELSNDNNEPFKLTVEKTYESDKKDNTKDKD